MPAVNDDFDRTVTRLGLDSGLSGIFTPDASAILRFSAADLARFNTCVAQVAPGMPTLDGPRLAGAARRLSRVVGTGNESRFIQTCMRRAYEVCALLGDAHGTCEARLHERMQAMIACIDDASGPVPDDVPGMDGLDDALLVDLAMEGLRGAGGAALFRVG